MLEKDPKYVWRKVSSNWLQSFLDDKEIKQNYISFTYDPDFEMVTPESSLDFGDIKLMINYDILKKQNPIKVDYSAIANDRIKYENIGLYILGYESIEDFEADTGLAWNQKKTDKAWHKNINNFVDEKELIIQNKLVYNKKLIERVCLPKNEYPKVKDTFKKMNIQWSFNYVDCYYEE